MFAAFMTTTSKSNQKIVWILGALATITPFAIDLYLPAFAQIANEFKSTTAAVSLSVSSYFIGLAIGQILYGPFLDRYGRKPPMYIGLFVFVLASIGCMMAWDVPSLIIFRFIQALGGSVAWVAAVAMVRDFFPVAQSARIFSLLFLIIGVSPLVAPTAGGFLVTWVGWKFIFLGLAVLTVLIVLIVYFFLPEGHKADSTISLKPGPMIATFLEILRNHTFSKYVLAGAFSFSTLFIYVAGSPIIFMEVYQVSPKMYGVIFAILSVGFIGGGQLNIQLMKKFSSEKIFEAALTCQMIASGIFLTCVLTDVLNLYGIIIMFFLCLSCIGLTNPNANALALAPFSRTVGSASALMGCIQIGVAALVSVGVGVLKASNALPVVMLMLITAVVAFVILKSFQHLQRQTAFK
jgi:DHA1 family bicyclomycin/chloramphenicol resistance-like MFS transporter